MFRFSIAMKLFSWSIRICPNSCFHYFLEYMEAIAEVGLDELDNNSMSRIER